MSTIWLTSDTHFGHRGILHWRPRFGVDPRDETVSSATVTAAVAWMDECLIEAWNSTVRPKDEVWHLGDFALSDGAHAERIFKSLHGIKHLVRGNHDPNRVCRLGWRDVQDMHTLAVGGKRYELCHYPLLTWNQAHHGRLHLHGHSHGNLSGPKTTRLDVGVDGRSDLTPWSIDEIEAAMADRRYVSQDHHAAA